MAAEALPVPAPRLRPFAAARNFVLFLVGFWAAAMGMARVVPFPNLGNLTRKFEHIRKHGDDYSLIYFGSSRVFHEFIPTRFDELLASRGYAMKSFNFGQDGMWPPESLYMVRKVLAERPAKLRWVLIDVLDIKARFGPDEAGSTTLRALYWHDWQHTRLAWKHILEVKRARELSWQEKLSLCWRHAELWMQQTASLGAGHQRLEISLKLVPKKKPARVKHEGYEPGKPGPLTGAQLADFTKEVTRLRTNPRPKPINAALRKAFDGIIADLSEANIQPVFVVASTIYGSERFSDWLPPGVPILTFDDPHKYPKLYDPAHRFDPHHLDPVGAEEFTRLLAERFAEILEARR